MRENMREYERGRKRKCMRERNQRDRGRRERE